MKKQFSTIMLTAVAAVLAMTACKNSPYPGYEMTDAGMYAKLYNHEEGGVKPKEGDLVRVTLVVKNDKDSVLTDSKDPKNNRPGYTYYEFPLMKSLFKGSFEDGLGLLSVGDSASFLISVDSMYKEKPAPPFLKKGTMLKYDVKLEKITEKAELEKQQHQRMEEQNAANELRKNEEPKALAKYLEDNKITAKPTASGLYYIETKKGSGPKAKAKDVVRVVYTGRLLDGQVFDSNDMEVAKAAGTYDEKRSYQPADFPLDGKVIKGWEEAMMMMSAGTKAKLIIPSSIGYGEQSGGPIPPYSTLVFDVELISINPAK
jgi:FKBP-type peptidyl-prolyl cis-trans isomerase FkpA